MGLSIGGTDAVHRGSAVQRLSGPRRLVPEDLDRRVAAFIRAEVNPGAETRDAHSEELPTGLMRQAAEIGLFGHALPAELGGGGADPMQWGLMLERIGYLSEDASFPALLSARVWVTQALLGTGRRDVIDRYVRRLARAELFGSFAYSDGADPFAFTSSVAQRGGKLVLNGEKAIVTGATSADVFVVFLNAHMSGGLAAVLVERRDRGVEVVPVEALGVRALGLGTLRMTDVTVPAERLLATDGLAFAQAMLNARRVLLVAGVCGAMQAIHQYCVDSLSQTSRYGVPLIELQAVQAALGRQYIAIESSRAVLHRALSRLAGDAPGFDPVFDPSVSSAKHEVTARSIEVALSAMRLLGGRGYLRGRAERFLRDSCSLLAAGGAQDVLETELGSCAVAGFESLEVKPCAVA